MSTIHQRREFMGYLLKPIGPLFLSTNGLQFIKAWEGFEPTPKPDPAGNCTVGYGHKLADGPCDPATIEASGFSQGMPKQLASDIMSSDVAEAERKLKMWLRGAAVTQSMYDALVSLTFNTGGNDGQWKVYKLTTQGQYQAAAMEFLDIDKAKNPETGLKVRIEGLTLRRKAEHDTYLQASYRGP